MQHRALAYLGAALGAAAITRAAVRRATAFDLHGKVALVTGGSRGLGFLIARELLAHGAKVAICARDEAELEHARAELATLGEVLAFTCDVTDREEIERLVVEVHDELGPIDVLVNNAGIIEVGPAELMGDAEYRRAMDTHFWASLHFAQTVLPDMIARRAGRIANVASIGGKIAVPHLLPYTASKFALVGLSEGLRAELARYGIAVTTIVPGLMRTGSHVQAGFKGQLEAEYRWFAASATSHLTSMNAERAARRIVRAIQHGDAELVLSIQAQVAVKAAALAPTLAQRVLSVIDRWLPAPSASRASSATIRVTR
jgi:NAD(P)-dependent dehydrogenase (short-subunit alcohol dehydrogenase family)